MERKIGEIFEYNGEWYQCLEDNGCNECAFRDAKCYDIREMFGNCAVRNRSDSESVIFKKLEKVGEPYTHYCPSGRIIYFQRYKLFYKLYSHNTEYIMCGFNEDGIVSIEIKQNKEDMEEKKVKLKKEDIDFLYNKFIEIIEDCVVKGYNIDNVQHEFGKLFLMFKDSDTKLNLKPFNLEQAKAGKPVCTRDGRKVRIICFDRINGDYYKIVACVTAFDGDFEEVLFYGIDGYIVDSQNPKDEDLMMLPEKKEGYVNLYHNCNDKYAAYLGNNVIYKDKEFAENMGIGAINYIKTVKVQWEE